jgi:hypothetical protein
MAMSALALSASMALTARQWPPELAVASRRELEEHIIVFLPRDTRNLEGARDCLENELNKKGGA